MKKCAIRGCDKNNRSFPLAHFFQSPIITDKERRDKWVAATGKTYSEKAKFFVCEDHFDVSVTDVHIYQRNII